MGQNLSELFDVVDEHDRVVGQAPRGEVHARELRHRAVHVLVVNARSEVFLQKRSLAKDTFPGAWDSSASGHLGEGEDYDTTALRELGEELGWQPAQAPRRLFKLTACRETGWEFVWVYSVAGEGPFQLQPEEIESGGWFTPVDIDRWVALRPEEFATAFVLLWPEARSRLTGHGS
ncbi:MAG: NUDIX domain-containing protein [Opitutaceae bacterium]|nr:NUDIX domain-containing protein [Opitutaceae bacterium]